jgi:hypothetical protein
MGFSFRKSFKIGAVRVNVSNRGIGASTGVKGARVGVNSAGRRYSSLSIPGTGLRYTSGGGGRRRTAVDDDGVEYFELDDGSFQPVEETQAAESRPGFFRSVWRGLGLVAILIGFAFSAAAFNVYLSADKLSTPALALALASLFCFVVGGRMRR